MMNINDLLPPGLFVVDSPEPAGLHMCAGGDVGVQVDASAESDPSRALGSPQVAGRS
jgi:hypothetical protein